MSAFKHFTAFFLSSLFLLGSSLFVSSIVGQEKDSVTELPDDARKVRDARREAMQKVAESLTLVQQAKEGEQNCVLVDHCLLYFTDSVYHPDLREGTMWVWQQDGLPRAVAQIFASLVPKDRWTVGLYSFCSDRLSIEDDATISRVLRPTDFRAEAIPDVQLPAKSKVGRTRQMKQLAKRFDAYNIPTKRFDVDQKRILLRRLPKPIHRYSNETAGVLDGAMFGFVHGGTNVQVVMLIEARRQNDQEWSWTVGFGRLDAGDNIIQFDDKEFWREAAIPDPLPEDWPSNYFHRIQSW